MSKPIVHRAIALVLLTGIVLGCSLLAAFSTDQQPMIPTIDKATWADVPPPGQVLFSLQLHRWLVIPTGDQANPSDLPPILITP